jgi:hypothetical protein
MMISVIRSTTDYGMAVYQSNCPYECTATDTCAASLSSMTISSGSKQLYCSNDNYDNCPVFLAKMLRKR